MSRSYFNDTVDQVESQGFKVLLEFPARGKFPRVSEVGYVFSTRVHDETKLKVSIALEYI